MIGAFWHLRKGKRDDIFACIGTEGNTIVGGKKVVKTPWKALMRHFIWRRRRWDSDEFGRWVDEFDPQVVVVMNSDATFILDIATYISKARNIPLVMYNTEGFYFFKDNYFHKSRWLSNIAYKLYQLIYKKHFRIMMKQVSRSVHLNSLLQKDYCEEFGGVHTVLYTGSTLNFDSSNLHLEKPTFTYLGNFGYDRPYALIDIADVLQSIAPNYKLDVYGKIPFPEIKRCFDSCPGINYRGMIPYEEVIDVEYSSTVLFHAEVQSQKYEEALRYGFSTKIADSISSGHPFVMYSSPDIAGAKYIIETGAGWHAKEKVELKEIVLSILNDDIERNRVLNNARQVAEANHSIERNADKWRELLCSLTIETK